MNRPDPMPARRTINGRDFVPSRKHSQGYFSTDAAARKRNAHRYAYAGDDPTNNLDPAGANLIGLSCASEISVGAAAILAGVGTGVAAGLADLFTGGVAILSSAGEAVAVASLASGGVRFVGDGINNWNGTGISRSSSTVQRALGRNDSNAIGTGSRWHEGGKRRCIRCLRRSSGGYGGAHRVCLHGFVLLDIMGDRPRDDCSNRLARISDEAASQFGHF